MHGQGRERVRDFLIENEDVLEKVKYEVRVALGLAKPDAAEEAGRAPEHPVGEGHQRREEAGMRGHIGRAEREHDDRHRARACRGRALQGR